jgi:hypothetical protein
MTMNVLNEGSVVLRLEFSIADAVRERGVIRVVGAAVRAWWAQRPINYSEVPPHLRADLGLPPETDRFTFVNPLAGLCRPPDRSRW